MNYDQFEIAAFVVMLILIGVILVPLFCLKRWRAEWPQSPRPIRIVRTLFLLPAILGLMAISVVAMVTIRDRSAFNLLPLALVGWSPAIIIYYALLGVILAILKRKKLANHSNQ